MPKMNKEKLIKLLSAGIDSTDDYKYHLANGFTDDDGVQCGIRCLRNQSLIMQTLRFLLGEIDDPDMEDHSG